MNALQRTHFSILERLNNRNVNPKRTKEQLKTPLIVLTTVILTILIISPHTGRGRTDSPETRKQQATPESIQTKEELTAKIAGYLEGQSDYVSVAVKDLNGGETYNLANEREYDGASTVKLAIVGYMYNQAANNQFDLDQVINIPSGDVQRYGTGSIQYEKGPWKYSYRQLAQRMMHESDNTAAYVLAKNLDTKKLQAFVDQIGLVNTSIEKNTTTASDMVLLMEKVYRSQLTEPSLNKELLDNMYKTKYEDRLPAQLPSDVKVFHKTGDAFDGGFHDVGVVEYNNRVYAVAIFTHGLTKEDIAEVSKYVFQYMTR